MFHIQHPCSKFAVLISLLNRMLWPLPNLEEIDIILGTIEYVL